MISEPNLQVHEKLKLEDLLETVSKSDIIIFFVGHKEFLPYVEEIYNNRKFIDFCGITSSLKSIKR